MIVWENASKGLFVESGAGKILKCSLHLFVLMNPLMLNVSYYISQRSFCMFYFWALTEIL